MSFSKFTQKDYDLINKEYEGLKEVAHSSFSAPALTSAAGEPIILSGSLYTEAWEDDELKPRADPAAFCIHGKRVLLFVLEDPS